MPLKLKSVSASNFANFTEISCSFDENLSYIVGGNGEGKSGIGVDILWTVLQGVGSRATGKDNFPVIAERIQVIGNRGPSARLSVTLRDVKTKQDIIVKRKVTKDGTELSFEGPDGMVLDQRWLNSIFNIFLINPKVFLQLTPKEQSISLGIDLSKEDAELKFLKETFTQIGRDLKSIGVITPVPQVKPVDVTALVKDKDERVKFNNKQIELEGTWKKVNDSLLKLTNEKTNADKAIIELNALRTAYESLKYTTEDSQNVIKTIHPIVSNKMDDLLTLVYTNEKSIEKGIEYSSTLTEAEPLKDITQLDSQIAQASETNVAASKYQDYLKAVQKKEKLEQAKEQNQSDQREVEKQRTEKIQSYDLPFAELSINEEGELLLQGRYLKPEYFSTGELIKTIPMLIIASAKRKGEIQFPFVFVSDFSLLDDKNQSELVTWFAEQQIQCVLEVVSSKPLGKANEIFLKDNVITTE